MPDKGRGAPGPGKRLRKAIKRILWYIKNVPLHQLIKDFAPGAMERYDAREARPFKVAPLPGAPSVADLDPPRSFILVKPFGIPRMDRIRELVETIAGYRILEELAIDDYWSLAHYLFDGHMKMYLGRPYPEAEIWYAILAKKNPACFNRGLVWLLDSCPAPELSKLKVLVRKRVGVGFYRVHDCQYSSITCITPIHTPDEARSADEWDIIMRFASRSASFSSAGSS